MLCTKDETLQPCLCSIETVGGGNSDRSDHLPWGWKSIKIETGHFPPSTELAYLFLNPTTRTMATIMEEEKRNTDGMCITWDSGVRGNGLISKPEPINSASQIPILDPHVDRALSRFHPIETLYIDTSNYMDHGGSLCFHCFTHRPGQRGQFRSFSRSQEFRMPQILNARMPAVLLPPGTSERTSQGI